MLLLLPSWLRPLRLPFQGPSRRNPLFIGNAFATNFTAALRGSARSRNPLFIGNAFATGGYNQFNLFRREWVAIPYSSGMLLLHFLAVAMLTAGLRRNPLFIGNAFATSLPTAAASRGLPANVAIPYSSGMLLLRRGESAG